MKPLPALVLLLAALAGCSDPPAASGDAAGDADAAADGDGNQTSDSLVPVGSPEGLTLDAVEPTLDATVLLSGTVTGPTNLTVEVAGRDGTRDSQALPADGAWSLEVPLGFGGNTVTATTEGGLSVSIEAVRLASATVEVLYTASPTHDDSQDTVLFNVDARPTLEDYEGRDVGHPDHFTVHDLLAEFTEQAGVAVEYDYSEGLGFAPIRFDGVGQPLTSDAPPWWCYKINGEAASLGASLMQVQPGDAVTWEYSNCVL